MRSKALFLIALLVLSVLLFSNYSKCSSINSVIVPETNSTILIDGNLNMTSEWNGSAILSWYNPLVSGYELDIVYLLFNSTHYLIGGSFYDPDTVKDDSISIYVDWGNTYKYTIDEGSSTLTLYNVSGGSLINTNGQGILTSSSPSNYRIYLELAIPKSEWNNASNVKMYIEHKHTFKIDTLSRYPENANPTDKSKWVEITFRQELAKYNVTIHFRDRDGNPIDYVTGFCYAIFYFSNKSTYTSKSVSNSSLSILLPPDNYTMILFVYDIPIFNTSLNVNSNITLSYTLYNLKFINTSFGTIVGIVELPSKIEGLYLEPNKQLGMLIANCTNPSALRLFPKVNWNYSFVSVLNALNFTYDPYTNTLLAYTTGNISGIMLIGAPKGYPVFLFSNGTIKGYIFDSKLQELCTWITNGTYKIFSRKEPFAVTLNTTALKRGKDYIIDPFNITTLHIPRSGDLRIYYKNPIHIEATATNNTLYIRITTPYKFSTSCILYILKDNVIINSITKTFTASPPETTIEVPLSLKPDNYTIILKVYDTDSNRLVDTLSVEYSIKPTVYIIPFSYWLIVLLLLIVIILLAILIKVKKSIVSPARKYLKLKTLN